MRNMKIWKDIQALFILNIFKMENLTYNEKLKQAGIETVFKGYNAFLKYGNQTIPRPRNPEDCRSKCLKVFKIDIEE